VRRIINSTYVSLDGVIQDPQDWPSIDGGDDTFTRLQTELLLGCDALLLGKDTYQGFASVWQGRPDDPYSEQMNALTKYVVSSTLGEPTWENTTVISGNAAEAVGRIKAEPGKDVVTYGFGRLGLELMEHGLLDEIRLWIHPFFIGSSGPDGLLFGHAPRSRLEHLGSETLKSGTIVARYAVTDHPWMSD
jgi:dihydrofolate reductase